MRPVAIAHFSGVCSTDIIVIRPKYRKYEGFLLSTVFSKTFVELASIASKGTKMPRADWDFLKKLELKIPDDNILKHFQDKFDDFFLQIRKLIETNHQLSKCRDKLLGRLISGKLPVDSLNIQYPRSMKNEQDAANA
jgi:type I restriction enzyme S subunit